MKDGTLKMDSENQKYAPSNVFEGLLSVRTLIHELSRRENARKIKNVYYDDTFERKNFKTLSWIFAESRIHDFEVTKTSEEFITSLSVGKTHGGIAAICDDKTYPALTPSLIVENGFYVMLDGIEDPYNFGTAVRSIYASGANGIVVPERNWMSSAGIVCRSSAGATETSDIYVCGAENAVKIFKSRGYKIVSSAKEKSISMYDADLIFPVFLLIGGERRGISKKVMESTDITVRIDYGRDFGGSLSAQSSAAILAFEVYRQNAKNK
ncbi:MAG: RNA methyltransferase [Firmicutes bacterium]|nr:RNA methyltransferase [Bacillota bacterium]